MRKRLATIGAALVLIFGGGVVTAPAASAYTNSSYCYQKTPFTYAFRYWVTDAGTRYAGEYKYRTLRFTDMWTASSTYYTYKCFRK